MNNTEIISKIAIGIQDIVKDYKYDFDINPINIDTYKHAIDDMMYNSCADKTITEEINKTGFPDEVILRIIEIKFDCEKMSIQDFTNISTNWEILLDRIGYVFSITLSKTTEHIIFNIDLGERGSDQCE